MRLFSELLDLMIRQAYFSQASEISETLKILMKALVVIRRTVNEDSRKTVLKCFDERFLLTILLQNPVKPMRVCESSEITMGNLQISFLKMQTVLETLTQGNSKEDIKSVLQMMTQFGKGYQNFLSRSFGFNIFMNANEFENGRILGELFENQVAKNTPKGENARLFEKDELYAQFRQDAKIVLYGLFTKMPFNIEKRRSYMVNCYPDLIHFTKYASYFDNKYFSANQHVFRAIAYYLYFSLIKEGYELGLELNLYSPNDYTPLFYLMQICCKGSALSANRQLRGLRLSLMEVWDVKMESKFNELIDTHEQSLFREFILNSMKEKMYEGLNALFVYLSVSLVEISRTQGTYLRAANLVEVAGKTGVQVVLDERQKLIFEKRWKSETDKPGFERLTVCKFEEMLSGRVGESREQVIGCIKVFNMEVLTLSKRVGSMVCLTEELREEIGGVSKRVVGVLLEVFRILSAKEWEKWQITVVGEDGEVRILRK